MVLCNIKCTYAHISSLFISFNCLFDFFFLNSLIFQYLISLNYMMFETFSGIERARRRKKKKRSWNEKGRRYCSVIYVIFIFVVWPNHDEFGLYKWWTFDTLFIYFFQIRGIMVPNELVVIESQHVTLLFLF